MLPASFGAAALVLFGFQSDLRQLSGLSVDRLQERIGAQQTTGNIIVLTYDTHTKNQAGAADLLDQVQLQELALWPVPRHMWADVIDRLASLQVKAIGFDVIFDQPRLEDQVFADAIRRFQCPVVLATGLDDADQMEFGSLSS